MYCKRVIMEPDRTHSLALYAAAEEGDVKTVRELLSTHYKVLYNQIDHPAGVVRTNYPIETLIYILIIGCRMDIQLFCVPQGKDILKW
jgi:hypothetical protein